MRLVLAGTPDTAVPSLLALLASPHEVVAVVTRPDARAGRGRTLAASPVKQVALEHGIEVLTPPTPRDPEFLARLAELEPDCCPVVAYGALVPREALDVPAPRLGQPALLAAAGLARCRSGAARHHGGRRRHRRHDLRARGGPRHRAGARHAHRDGAPRRHRGHPARPAGPRRSRSARRHDGRPGRRLAARGAAAGRGRQPRAQAQHRRGAGALDACRPTSSTGTCAAAPRPPARGRRSAGSGSSSGRSGSACRAANRVARVDRVPGRAVPGDGRPRRRSCWRPASCTSASRAVLVGTGSAPVELGEVGPTGRKPMAAADWARGIRIAPGERLDD